jgi:UDP-3-O-[3-hydroxymyristoyl] glucosamine N-acyltransferase
MTVNELAQKLGCEVHGDGKRVITGVCGMEQAGPEHVTFLANPRYAHKVKESRAGAILTASPIEGEITCLISSNPYLDFSRALAFFYQPPRPEPGIHDLAFVDPSASVGENASIGPFAVVGPGASIGRNAVLYPQVVVYEGAQIGDDFTAHSQASVREFCRIGHRVTLQNGVVIGGDGFGFAKRADGTHAKIGHACVVGEDNIICAQTGLAGSTVLEKNVLLAGQVGVSGHLTIHENAIVYAQSGVGGDVSAGARISGSPAFESRDWLRAATAFPKLPELLRTVRELEKRVHELESRASQRSDE